MPPEMSFVKGRRKRTLYTRMKDSDVEKVKDRLSIVEVVGQYIQLQRAGRNFRARCPFHKEKTPSFMISPERGSYMCFGCGEKGDIFSFVEKIESIDFPTALRQLAERAGVELQHTFTQKRENSSYDDRLKEVCEEATKFFVSTLFGRKDVQEYLRIRGIHDETAASFRLGYAPASWRDLVEYLVTKGFTKDEIADAGLAARSEKKPGEVYDRFRGRIMFPINDASGNVIAFSGRFFEKVPGSKEEGDPAKYVNSPETPLFKKSKVLFGLDRAKQPMRKADCILLVEGQVDLVMSHQSGLPFAVALSGTALTQEHLSLLGRFSKRLVLALDADQAGIRAGLKSALMALQAGFDVKIPTFHDAKDPADVARENPELLKAAVRTSQTAVEFFLDALRPSAKDDRGYKRIVETQVLPLIAVLGSKIEQEHFIRIVASRIGVSEEAVRAEVNKRPALPTTTEETLSPIVAPQVGLSQLEERVGMLIAYFGEESEVGARLRSIVGDVVYQTYKERTLPHQELLRFKFESEIGESEVGETVDASTLANDMLKGIELARIDEEIASATTDTVRIMQLVRRKEELRS